MQVDSGSYPQALPASYWDVTGIEAKIHEKQLSLALLVEHRGEQLHNTQLHTFTYACLLQLPAEWKDTERIAITNVRISAHHTRKEITQAVALLVHHLNQSS